MISILLLFVVSCGTKEFSVDVDGKGKVPDFELKDLNGKSANLGKIMKNGKKTLFIIAAEWCPHCRAELPEVQKFYEKYKDKVNVVVVFLGSSSLEEVKGYVSNSEFTFPVYYDDDNSILEGFDIQSVLVYKWSVNDVINTQIQNQVKAEAEQENQANSQTN